MSNMRLLVAKELIQEKRYQEAESLLRTVDHPIATEWLAQLAHLKVKAKKKKRNKSIFSILKFFGCSIIILMSCSWIASLSPVNNTQSSRNITSSSPSRENITSESYIEAVRNLVSGFGRVENHEQELNSDGRVVIWTDIILDRAHANKSTAVDVMEQMLRIYIDKYPIETSGRFSGSVAWGDTAVCWINMGMGYKTQEQIAWQTASWNRIAATLNKGRYTDNTPHYSNISWIKLATIPKCN